MGTRHLIAVQKDNEYKVAQYGQWDGYLSGQGVHIFSFIRDNREKMDEFRDQVRALKAISEEDLEKKWEQVENIGQDSEHLAHFSRDCGAKILQLRMDGKVEEVYLREEFAADGLFCEWAYVLDLDKEVLEIYEGFRQEPHQSGRFANMKYPRKKGDKYYPVALFIEFPFDGLPGEAADFIKMCEVVHSPSEPFEL